MSDRDAREKNTHENSPPGAGTLGVRDVRTLRQAADTLADTADLHRAALIDRLGLKRYIFNVLGQTAHRPVNTVQLVWPDGTEQVGSSAKLGEYLHERARKEQRLPHAVLAGGKKYYL